ncbi:hypothetical protein Mp_8g02240 [Marchantia polymorpha subsp. ruderalis]|uniref:TMC domain-containing protein n=1 Tax=Marchantia polymorpha TaxID=3197 RepID=A0A2R6XJ18_MARPO|nr:hypothetical protein MARPO_0012s0021 [Marchantia polymorpha]PTQ46057.1 hypothetical protein MARPO_0012s0021 [Marchantia polymorpha]BBN18409.1 hypothetical protein Mp_8g02240 [Marchantia polymorpha subsp. ruderalis]BBN18410.1 hypothetical protein Mp_8g02240 [Marchantia polymorpha subsp. ruderalis]|eukprot:PTQ46056.1 hypothetical protein MARPO_0012s0021 [Marchantia polymorpha]
MASSFAEKILKATVFRAKGSDSTSPTRKYSASSSTSKKVSSSSSSSPSKRAPVPDPAVPLPRTSLSNVGASTRRTSASGVPSSISSVFDGKAASRNATLTKTPSKSQSQNPATEVAFVTGPPYAVRASTRLQESPYGKQLAYEKTPRRSSYTASLQNLSAALSSPQLSPSPLVSTLGSSPGLDFGDVPGISSSPLVGEVNSPARTAQQHSDSSSEDETPRLGISPDREQQEPGSSGQQRGAAHNFSTFNHPNSSVNVGGAFTGVVPSDVSLMTNPLYPVISPLGSSPPQSAPHIDGFNIPAIGINLPNAASDLSPVNREEEINPLDSAADFLQKRKAAAASQRQKGPGAGDPNSAASQAILKRRTQVLSTVQKAKSRLSMLTFEVTKKRRSFKNNCFGRFRRWMYERERRRMMGKGTVFNKLWLASLKEMEVSYGSPMMLAFSFIRWVFLLNGFLALIWVCMIVIPFMAHPPKTFSWKVFWHNLGDKKALKDTFQGSNLEKSFVYYGGYTYTRAEQEGWYRVDYMYGVMIAATFLFSFLCVLIRIAGTIMSSGDIAMAARLYPFSSLVFASWDFHLINIDAASKLRRGIRMQLREMLADAGAHEKTNSLRDRLMSAKRATALFVLWPLLMAGTVAVVVELVTKAERVNAAFGSNYAQAVLLSVLNIVTPMLIRVLVDMEDFKPATAERVVLMKLFCVRVLNLASLYYRLFMMLDHTLQLRENNVVVESCLGEQKCDEGFTCCKTTNLTQWNICTDRDINYCLPACTENIVGTQLLRLIFMTTLINNAYEVIYGFGYVWLTSGNKRQLYIEDMAIDIVYVQSLVWVGSCFSPLATVLGFFSNLLTWYGMRLALFRTCGPVEKAHSASRTSSLTYGLLLLTLILSTIPATLNVMQRSSGFCGPIHERVSMYTVLTSYIQKAPSGLWLTVQWLTNPAVLLGVILLLVFGVVLLQSKLVQSRQFLALTKHEMGMQRREASEKLTRVRQTVQPSGGSFSGPAAKVGLPSSFRGSTEASASPVQVEAFLFPLANEGQEPGPGGQSRSSVLQTARRRSSQPKDQMPRPSLLPETMSRQAPRASRPRASTISTVLGRVASIWGNQSAGTRTTSRTSLVAEGSSKNESEDEIRAPIALIRGFSMPPNVAVAAGSSMISVLTPSSGSSIWGSLSSEPRSTSRTSISLPGGGSDSMVTARTSFGGPVGSSIKASYSAALAIKDYLWGVRGRPESGPSPHSERQTATPSSVSRSSVTSSAKLGAMPSARSSRIARNSVSLRSGPRGKSLVRSSLFSASASRKTLRDANSPDRSSSISHSGTEAAVKHRTKASLTGAGVSWWRKITGRSSRKRTSRSLSRKLDEAGSRSPSPLSGSVSPIVATNGVEQWLSRAGEGSQWASEPQSPRGSGSERGSAPRGQTSVDDSPA